MLMSRLTVSWVSGAAVASSGPSPLGSLIVSEQGFSLLVSGGGHELRLFAHGLGQAICFFNASSSTVGWHALKNNSAFLWEKLQVSWWTGWSKLLEKRNCKAAFESVRVTVICGLIFATVL